jgi:hypothetical protein
VETRWDTYLAVLQFMVDRRELFVELRDEIREKQQTSEGQKELEKLKLPSDFVAALDLMADVNIVSGVTQLLVAVSQLRGLLELAQSNGPVIHEVWTRLEAAVSVLAVRAATPVILPNGTPIRKELMDGYTATLSELNGYMSDYVAKFPKDAKDIFEAATLFDPNAFRLRDGSSVTFVADIAEKVKFLKKRIPEHLIPKFEEQIMLYHKFITKVGIKYSC